MTETSFATQKHSRQLTKIPIFKLNHALYCTLNCSKATIGLLLFKDYCLLIGSDLNTELFPDPRIELELSVFHSTNLPQWTPFLPSS